MHVYVPCMPQTPQDVVYYNYDARYRATLAPSDCALIEAKTRTYFSDLRKNCSALANAAFLNADTNGAIVNDWITSPGMQGVLLVTMHVSSIDPLVRSGGPVLDGLFSLRGPGGGEPLVRWPSVSRPLDGKRAAFQPRGC